MPTGEKAVRQQQRKPPESQGCPQGSKMRYCLENLMGKTLLSKDFVISESVKAWARDKCPNVDLDVELEKFRDYWLACGRKMMDWDATLRNWLRRAPQFAKRNGTAPRWKPEGLH